MYIFIYRDFGYKGKKKLFIFWFDLKSSMCVYVLNGWMDGCMARGVTYNTTRSM